MFFVAIGPGTVFLIPSRGFHTNYPTGISNSRCSTELISLLSKPHPLPIFSSLVRYLFYPTLKLGTYHPHLSVPCIPTHRIKFSPKTENARASDLDSGSVLETALSPLLITAQDSTRQLQG